MKQAHSVRKMRHLYTSLTPMTPRQFKRWRKSLDYSQKEAAQALGLKRRIIQYYEKGERDGEKVVIPKSVRLACYALAEGCNDYHGPVEAEEA